ncbi:hypothetical protein AV530_014537 [Patagioenas fasciata monilis]|uniref:Uncharacterized protein n=1 Tax=Patagioenas fasciata monilis TaxID=372326 RepID=A0A1V4KCC2_PATFA|nr:hypothetical protein AV530_014537 [Patagioenas fasciata monilis]
MKLLSVRNILKQPEEKREERFNVHLSRSLPVSFNDHIMSKSSFHRSNAAGQQQTQDPEGSSALASCSEEDKVHTKDALWKGRLIPWCVISSLLPDQVFGTRVLFSQDWLLHTDRVHEELQKLRKIQHLNLQFLQCQKTTPDNTNTLKSIGLCLQQKGS